MTPQVRQEIHAILMRAVSGENSDAHLLVSGLAWSDADALAPLWDRLLFDAYNAGYRAGQRFANRKTELQIVHSGGRE